MVVAVVALGAAAATGAATVLADTRRCWLLLELSDDSSSARARCCSLGALSTQRLVCCVRRTAL